jgi:hypothetical protein
MPTALGYFFLTFENGLGNISPPTVEVWQSNHNQTITATLIIYLIYLTWWCTQLIILIVLLNFVIALISQVYENVMDSKMVHVYTQK